MPGAKLPLTLNFDDSLPAYGWVELSEHITKIPNMEEYLITPSARWLPDEREWEIIGYSLVHIGNIPNQQQFYEKLYQVSGDDKYKEQANA